MSEDGVMVERRYSAPGDLVWALLADTHRYNRALGLTPPRYVWRDVDGRRTRVAEATQNGVTMSWVDEPYEWIEGQRLVGRRTFLSGPAIDGGIAVEVEEDGEGGCVARMTTAGRTRSLLLKLINPLIHAHLRRSLKSYMDATAAVVATRDDHDDDSQPAAVRAQTLLTRLDNVVTSGKHTPVDQAELERRADRLGSAPVDPEVVRQLVSALGQRPDEEIAQMRPFELARHWGLDRRHVLQAFLHGTRAGLVDLDWQINCPVCRVSAQVVSSLADVADSVHCEACNIRYDVDFGANVEAVFRCNKAVREVEPTVYCTASPGWRPHVIAQLRVDAGVAREVSLPLLDGRMHLRTLADQRAADLVEPHPPALVEIEVGAEAVTATASGRALDGKTTLRIRSTLDETAYLLVERGAWASDAVLGSIVASMPDFVDLFSTEAPAAGLPLTIGRITLLFSDLTGSTALYEQVGDARAYAVVQEHFGLMEQAIAAHEGAVIKTMGDAVMASFTTPQQAVAAALQAVRDCESQHGALGIGVKLGIHEGPCLAVRANERLDFFGTTVNLAARLQGQAGAGELVLMHELSRIPAVASLLEGRSARAVTARLKGISEAQELVAIDLRKARRESQAGESDQSASEAPQAS
ncbi:adenylate/guanylate cyclase domain-containing protein [Paraliomyxa miuraensis]|uniref:adenylate/guanylate cyclase domain-containing protein n=1 Tax=Paraliomyxa miuraensis TaxID=376150 RepID=UPI0022554E4B|nr:adenylate/guanylate cyclase domain-containing protein [Paraliomyxa miuraensis]MCX4243850.1 DUF5939 domain-containing protein [Paraliomyxa miuraensis]